MTPTGKYSYPYPRPSMTVDCVIWTIRDEAPSVVMIQRKHDPFAGSWAFPGGFVDENEPLERAARRELAEETGITPDALCPVATFGDPGRDPRGWTVSAAYYGVVSPEVIPRGGDDAAAACWRSARRPPKLAFDHKLMLRTALDRLRHEVFTLPILAPLLPAEFTPADLAKTYRPFLAEMPSNALLVRRLVDAGLIERTRRGARRFRFVRQASSSPGL